MSTSRKLYRVEWTDPKISHAIEPQKQVMYKLAFDVEEILEEFLGDEVMTITEASRPEQEAYISGYTDGQDTANISFKLNALEQDDLD